MNYILADIALAIALLIVWGAILLEDIVHEERPEPVWLPAQRTGGDR
ncbi:hypothetical protein [Streptomyces sp. NPDC059597]